MYIVRKIHRHKFKNSYYERIMIMNLGEGSRQNISVFNIFYSFDFNKFKVFQIIESNNENHEKMRTLLADLIRKTKNENFDWDKLFHTNPMEGNNILNENKTLGKPWSSVAIASEMLNK